MTQPQHASSDYRADIDGLRAVAVVAVLLYHAFPRALPGGFAGVDIFFVISGYLISRIIIGDLRKGTFTFSDFYSRRIRRIFPALTLVLVTCLVVGWWGLLPADFRHLGAHVSAGAGFVSNLLLWSESGYFDTAAELKPLLHLWSLGVEEQYYLVWPLALFLFRRHMHSIFWMILAVAVASFALNVVATARLPEAAFYLPPTRFWELMIGSLIAYAQVFKVGATAGGVVAPTSGRLANLMSITGFALLALTFILLNEKRAFPGWWAVLPTAGAALIICAGSIAWLNRILLTNRVAVYIGLISYPLYLWHWPLFAYARVFNDSQTPSAGIRIALMIASVALACLTYELIEKRVRHARRATWSHRVMPVLGASMSALCVYGLVAFGSFSQSRSAAVPRLAAVSEAFDDEDFMGNGTFKGDSPRSVLFFGDSHMRHYMPRIAKILDERQMPVRSVIVHTRNGCAPMPGVERRGRACDDFVRAGLKIAGSKNVDTVVFSASWVGFVERDDLFKVGEEYSGHPITLLMPGSQWVFDGFEAQLKQLTDAGKHVILVLSSPRGVAFDPRGMVKRSGLAFQLSITPSVPRSQIHAIDEAVDRRLRAIALRVGATTVNPLDTLCSGKSCPTSDADGSPLYMDYSHLRATVARDRLDLLDRFVYL